MYGFVIACFVAHVHILRIMMTINEVPFDFATSTTVALIYLQS